MQNSILFINNSNFEENFSFDNGGVIRGDYKKTKTSILNSNFTKNGAFQGGVFAPLYESLIECQFCNFIQNFGLTASVVFSHNHGYVKINSSLISNNTAFSVKIGEFLDTVNI